MALSPASASCHALRCFVLQQLSRHEATPGCDRARSAASVAAPAAGLRGDNTGSSTSDFIGLDGSGPTKKRTGGPLEPGDGETTEHGGSGKKQASAVAAASLALASAGQEMELLMHKHGDLEDKCEELKRKLDEVVKERDELQAKNAGLLAYKRGTAGTMGLAVLRKKREGAVLTVADDSTWDARCSCVQLTAIAEQERGEGGVTGKSTKSCLLTRNQKPVIDLPCMAPAPFYMRIRLGSHRRFHRDTRRLIPLYLSDPKKRMSQNPQSSRGVTPGRTKKVILS